MDSKSIAILPLVNLSSDPENEYFSDGITEEIILALSMNKGLKVTARTSSFMFKGQNLDVRKIGEQLGVSTILEGSVRKAGNNIRISVRLIQTEDGFEIWSAKFDRQFEDIFKLQDEISVLVADKIRENFGHIELQSPLVTEEAKSVDAYDYYLKGRYEQLKWTNDALQRAINFYKKSIEIEPDNSRAYYGIVFCSIYLAFWSADEKDISNAHLYLEKAAGVKRNTPEYFHAKASVEMMIEWNFEDSISNFHRLLEITPNNPEVLEAISGLYLMVGNFKEAMVHIDRAIEINPLSLNHTFMKGNINYFSGEYEEAIYQVNKVIKQDPTWLYAVQLKAAALILLNKGNELEDLLDDYDEYPFMNHYMTLFKLYNGIAIDEYEVPFLEEETIHAWQLYFSTLEGKYDSSIQMLEDGLEQKQGKYMCFNSDPFLVKLRTHSEYSNLLRFVPMDLELLSDLYEVKEKNSPLISDDYERVELINALDKCLDQEQLFLDADLSLKKLADSIETSANKLSWLINENKEMNFNDFINTYRVEYFKSLALDPVNQNITLLGLAFDSGFNSKSAFNHFFKKKTGQTPRAWLKSQN